MIFSTDKKDDALIAVVAGQVNSANAADLESQMLACVAGGEYQWVVDLGRLDYISSAGLRVILMLAKRLREQDGGLVLCNLQSHVHEVFEVSGFLTILQVTDDRAQALQQLQQ
ncbi:MAG TPA: STAS domain-containing protein [Burkholderiaceae bacterium]|nr:STAS domain-containing protein [Burkholderiaceae bacterium]